MLRREKDALHETDRAVAQRVIEDRAAILQIFGELLSRRFATAKTRVHGDLHLGQLLNTGKEFAFIDFEGEAPRPLGERMLKRCPFVDLAAMIRSLDYAASAAMRRESESDRSTLRAWAALWVREMTAALSAEYFAAADGASFIPPTADEREALLKIFLLDRALRELAGEITRKSEFVGVPLGAIAELLAASATEVAAGH